MDGFVGVILVTLAILGEPLIGGFPGGAHAEVDFGQIVVLYAVKQVSRRHPKLDLQSNSALAHFLS